MNVPFKVNLQDQVALITGGGGVLCSTMARALAACGARVAVADLKQEAAEIVAAQIRKEGGQAISVACNVLEKESLMAANDKVKKEFGAIDILINGAGGNHPKGTTSLEHLRKEDLAGPTKDLITFYDLDPKGVEFVFNLNFLGTLLPTQAFTREMAGKGKGTVVNISSMNAFRPLTKIPAYSGAQAPDTERERRVPRSAGCARSSTGKQAGAVHRTAAPSDGGFAPGKLLRAEAAGSARSRWREVGRV